MTAPEETYSSSTGGLHPASHDPQTATVATPQDDASDIRRQQLIALGREILRQRQRRAHMRESLLLLVLVSVTSTPHPMPEMDAGQRQLKIDLGKARFLCPVLIPVLPLQRRNNPHATQLSLAPLS